MISGTGENLVFLLGMARSGTTLLSVMLNRHDDIRCPPEPWLMLALDAIGRASAHHPADAPVLYRALREFAGDSIDPARAYALDVYNRALGGKKIFIDKTPRYYLILPYLKRVFPDAKYIVLWRNPLDVAASMKQAWGFDLPRLIAAEADHLACFDLLLAPRRIHEFARAVHAHVLRYEDMVRDPQNHMRGVFDFLGVANTDVAKFNLSGGEFQSSEYGDKKILQTESPHAESIDRWQRVFTPEEIQILVRAIDHDLASELGYQLPGAVMPSVSKHFHQRLEEYLQTRLDEYEKIPTYCDLRIEETRLGDSINLEPAHDLRTTMRNYAAGTGKLRSDLLITRPVIIEIQARLEESRQTNQQQIADAAKREWGWSSRLEHMRLQLEAAREELAASNQARATAAGELQKQQEQSAALKSQLAETRQAVDRLLRQQEAEESLSLAARIRRQFSSSSNGHGSTGVGSALRQLAKRVQTFAGATPDMMDSALKHLADKGFSPSVVLDIGAAKGYWTQRFAWLWPAATFYLIDPLDENEPYLRELGKKDERFRPIFAAVGREEGNLTMNITPDFDGSSFMRFPNPDPARQRTIAVRTIDTFLSENAIAPPQLVKLDVQGFEINVMEGGKKMLESAEVIIAEVSLFRFMENCPLADEVVRYMSDRNFVLFDLAGMLRRPFEADLGQMDLVFVARRSPLVASTRWA